MGSVDFCNHLIVGFMNKGATLIELMVAIAIFSIVIVAVINLFSALIERQKDLFSRAYVLNNLSYSMEYMSKGIRMAQKDLTGTCIGYGNNFSTTNGSNIKFLNHYNECVEFFLENNIIKIKKLGISQALTPADLVVEGLNFVLFGESQNDNFQPKVSFSIKIKPVNSIVPVSIIQTTVSQRMLDILY